MRAKIEEIFETITYLPHYFLHRHPNVLARIHRSDLNRVIIGLISRPLLTRNEKYSPSAPRIELSASPAALSSAFSIAAGSRRAVAIPLVLVAIDSSDVLRSVGILDENCGNICPRRKLSMMEKEGLTVPKESKAVITGEVLPFREPKSCEKAPIPMLSSLGGV